MEEKNWLLTEIDDLLTQVTSYEEKALYLSLKKLIAEQYNRLEQLEGQLDGTLWSPKEWGGN
ncbi:hypothetical protein FE258_00830 [Vagococcus zengguangii]|uniref:Uncharacterized protein n=2 Tax=Vagococcus zengguangii TaxID=2571750 RepID=A0A4D7CT64_9ENTE|nr:hypothetical protein [Vagococcus zengguangii]QCI87329.1 hypothetical protein FA707_01850 [Vagococcus zengguangii]TLG81725.1 hypothetical protein FE258_00830 [Vagococcus zengguangii]